MLNKQLTKVASGIMTVGIPGYTGRIDYAGARTSKPAPKQPQLTEEEMRAGLTGLRRTGQALLTPFVQLHNALAEQAGAPAPASPKPAAPANVKWPAFKRTLDVLHELPKVRKAQPLTGGDANAWRANASAALGKAAPGIAGIRTGVRGGAMPPTPAPADAPIVRPKSNKPALGSVEDRRAVYAKAGQPADAPIVRPVRPSRAERLANAAEATKAMAPASRTAAIGNAMMRGARPNAAPASAAVQPRTLSIKDITADDMKKYRKYTAAGDMNSEMDRWKTLQAMQGNRNASNKDYRAAKKRGEVK